MYYVLYYVMYYNQQCYKSVYHESSIAEGSFLRFKNKATWWHRPLCLLRILGGLRDCP